MPLMTWNERYSVKVRDFDNEHKKLIELLNLLHESMKKGEGKSATGKVLNELISYTQTHFKNEEVIMKANNYPDFNLHKSEHQKLIAEVADFKKKFDAGSITLSVSIISFLQDWVKNHIMIMDKQYSDFLNQRGIN